MERKYTAYFKTNPMKREGPALWEIADWAGESVCWVILCGALLLSAVLMRGMI